MLQRVFLYLLLIIVRKISCQLSKISNWYEQIKQLGELDHTKLHSFQKLSGLAVVYISELFCNFPCDVLKWHVYLRTFPCKYSTCLLIFTLLWLRLWFNEAFRSMSLYTVCDSVQGWWRQVRHEFPAPWCLYASQHNKKQVSNPQGKGLWRKRST